MTLIDERVTGGGWPYPEPPEPISQTSLEPTLLPDFSLVQSYREALGEWQQSETATLADRPQLTLSVLTPAECGELTVDDVGTLPVGTVLAAVADQTLLERLPTAVQLALWEQSSKLIPNTRLGRAGAWLGRKIRKLSFENLTPEVPPGRENPFAPEWRAEAARQLSDPAGGTGTLEATEPVATDDLLKTEQGEAHDEEQNDSDYTQALRDLENALVKAHLGTAAKALAEQRQQIVTKTIQAYPQFSWLAHEAPFAVQRVINTVLILRERAAKNGQVITDKTFFKRYQRAAEVDVARANSAGELQSESQIQQSFRIFNALMGGSHKGTLPF